MARVSGKSEPIRNRDQITKVFKAIMRKRFPDDSIDSVNSRPVDAMDVYLTAAVEMDQLSKSAAERIRTAVRKSFRDEQGAEDVMNEMSRAALNSRKRGDLRVGTY